MRLTVNGKTTETEAPALGDFLAEQRVKSPDQVSIELNGRILPREEYGATILSEGDQVEFFYFMGGGRGTH
jgi:thiamine biosynthesis protein ThiS